MGGRPAPKRCQSQGGREGGREGGLTFVFCSDEFLGHKQRDVAMPGVTLAAGLVRFCDGDGLLLPGKDHRPFEVAGAGLEGGREAGREGGVGENAAGLL